MQSNSNALEGIQTSLFTMASMKPMTIAPSSTNGMLRRTNNFSKAMAPTRAHSKINMGVNTDVFAKAGKRMDMTLKATSGKVEMRSNSADYKIQMNDKLENKPMKISEPKKYVGQESTMLSSKMEAKIAHAAAP